MTNQAAPTKTKNRTLLIIGVSVGLLFFVAIIFAYRSGIVMDKRQVKYVVSGSVPSALIKYNNEQGKPEQIDVNLPWEKEMKVSPGAILSIVAQTSGSRTDTITCEIWLNSNQRQATTSIAEYGLVTCTDLTP